MTTGWNTAVGVFLYDDNSNEAISIKKRAERYNIQSHILQKILDLFIHLAKVLSIHEYKIVFDYFSIRSVCFALRFKYEKPEILEIH